ncbi:MAG: N-6 DNA methylase, partial [Firmicutes bacterium]|nr:N-6 DNA methylase [Bacillota bacterium]
MSLIDYAVKSTTAYIENMPKSLRKNYGQFFTSKETAQFMASLFDIPKDKSEITVLDPGAGSGILSIALLDRLREYDISAVELVCYENDEKVIELLRKNLDYMTEHLNYKLNYYIKN